MLIVVTKTGHVELREAENFRAFKIFNELGRGGDRPAAALDGRISVNALVSLLAEVPTPQWQTAFDDTLARKSGWVDDASNTLRAHIEPARIVSDPKGGSIGKEEI